MSTYRRAAPGARFLTTDSTGRRVKLVADELGVITITTPAEARAADSFGLPVTKLPRASGDEVAKSKKKE